MNQEKIGKFIAKLRKEKNMTQEELATKLGTSNKSVSRWENGKCMPDLALFPLISEELNISINELMSGEAIDKKEYQETFEKNVVKTISKVDKNKRNWNIVCYTVVIIDVLFLLWIIVNCILHYYTFIPKFDASKIEIKLNDNGFEYIIYDTCSMNNEYLITKYKENNIEVGIIFIKTICNFDSYLNFKKNNKDNYDLTQPNSSSITNVDLSYTKIPSKYKVYYTDVNFNKIRKANTKELEKIIKESNLIYEKEL